MNVAIWIGDEIYYQCFIYIIYLGYSFLSLELRVMITYLFHYHNRLNNITILHDNHNYTESVLIPARISFI